MAACCTGPQKSWVPEGAGTAMGESPVSPTTTLCPQGKRRKGGEGGWVFSSPPQLRCSVGITRKNRVPLRPQSPAGPTPCCGQGFSGGTMRSSVGSLLDLTASKAASGHSLDSEVTQDHCRTANGDLYMGFVLKCCTWVDKVPFFKDAIDGVLGIHSFCLPDFVDHFNDSAIQLPLHENAVLPRRVLGEGCACSL